jgi:hypothetical protein
VSKYPLVLPEVSDAESSKILYILGEKITTYPKTVKAMRVIASIFDTRGTWQLISANRFNCRKIIAKNIHAPMAISVK